MATEKVRDIMNLKVRTLRRSDSLQLAKDLMTQGHIRHFPVLEGDKLVGVVSERDLLRASFSSLVRYGEKQEKAFFDTVSIKGVVNEPAITISPDASIQEAGRLILDQRIGCLPVVEGGKLQGLVTGRDILRALVEN